MTEQPAQQPPEQPLHQPSGSPAGGEPATQPMQAAPIASPASPPVAPTSNVWHQATSTHGGRWAIGIAAAALACLMLLGVGVASLLVLRNHNAFGMMGQQQNRFSRNHFGQGNGGNGSSPSLPGMPGAPGMRGGRAPGGLGSLLGGTALHGSVTATVNGSPQALVFQRGQVTAISATSITLQSSDGFTGTYGRTAQTSTRTAVPVTGGQALVLARASDKVAITIVSTTQANTGVGPTS
jgi:hypothetical protein